MRGELSIPRLIKAPYTALLAALILLLVAWPALEEWRLTEDADSPWRPVSAIIHGLLFTLLLATILRATSRSRRSTLFLVLMALAFVGTWADDLITGRETTYIGQSISVLFMLYATGLVLQRVLRGGLVTINRIIAAVCAYLLIGMVFAALYWLLWHLDEDAFRFPLDEVVVLQGDFTYFSFTTLTTLGYGEITPVHPLARSLAYLEATLGQIYIAVVIARLVALEILHGAHDISDLDDDQESSSSS